MSKRRKSQVFSDDSDEDSNEEVLPAFLDHARNHYTDELPPFIQERLSPGISPGDQREVLARTKSGNFPSSSTSRAKETLTCRAWDNLGNRFWTMAVGNDCHIVKAFATQATPKVSFHAWQGVDRPFGRTRVAFDEDDSIYFGAHRIETPLESLSTRRSSSLASPLVLGVADSNKGFREQAVIVQQAEMAMHARQTSPGGECEPAIWHSQPQISDVVCRINATAYEYAQKEKNTVKNTVKQTVAWLNEPKFST